MPGNDGVVDLLILQYDKVAFCVLAYCFIHHSKNGQEAKFTRQSSQCPAIQALHARAPCSGKLSLEQLHSTRVVNSARLHDREIIFTNLQRGCAFKQFTKGWKVRYVDIEPCRCTRFHYCHRLTHLSGILHYKILIPSCNKALGFDD